MLKMKRSRLCHQSSLVLRTKVVGQLICEVPPTSAAFSPIIFLVCQVLLAPIFTFTPFDLISWWWNLGVVHEIGLLRVHWIGELSVGYIYCYSLCTITRHWKCADNSFSPLLHPCNAWILIITVLLIFALNAFTILAIYEKTKG